MSGRVPLTLACWDYDRTSRPGERRHPARRRRPHLPEPAGRGDLLPDAQVPRVRRRGDVPVLLRDQPARATGRSLRSRCSPPGHSGTTVSTSMPPAASRSRLTCPDGRRVAEYQLTANVWIRGILAEHHGVPVGSVRYRTGGLHQPGRVAKVTHDPPPGVEIEPIPPTGRWRACSSPGRSTRCTRRARRARSAKGTPGCAGCSPTPGRTRSSTTRRPGSSRSCTWSCSAATCTRHGRGSRSRCTRRSRRPGRLASRPGWRRRRRRRYMLPWLYAEAERTQQLMGTDFWSYGLAGNEAALAVFLRYSPSRGSPAGCSPRRAVRPRDQGKLRDLMSLRRGRRCP